MKTIALAVALLGILAVAGVWVVTTLMRGGTSELPTSTWIVMIVGVIIALGVGFGLMALSFWSAKKGKDEEVYRAGEQDEDRQ